MEYGKLSSEQSKNITGKDLTLELENKDVTIEFYKKDKTIEISDINGTFGIWIKVTEDKFKKLKEIVEKGP